MISELKKSTNSILFERVTSPFWGTVIVSWGFWNWKIIYLTFFISESKIPSNKIEFIISNYYNIWDILIFPLVSSFLLLTVVPFISNGAFWLNLIFKNWRVNKKNDVENTQLLSIEQSVLLRTQIREKEIEFEKVLDKKNNEEELLKARIIELETQIQEQKISNEKNRNISNYGGNSFSSDEYEVFTRNNRVFEPFEKIAKSIKEFSSFPEDTDSEIIEYYIINGIVEEEIGENYNRYYQLSLKGDNYYKEFFNHKFNDQK